MTMKSLNPNKAQDEMDDVLYNYVATRDNGLCQVCGSEGTQEHHVLYKSMGGKNKANNLILLCWKDHIAEEHGRKARPRQFYFDRIKTNERRLREKLI